ncbi:hypothetical protein KP509_29G035600 [Ceratopteris richardii]|nr:hypothetical protein KP509_29G035600 [Ceratopteris richardii]
MSASDHLTPNDEPTHKDTLTTLALSGSFIHLSQSADGKLRWDHPSSSTSSLSEVKELSDCLSAGCSLATTANPCTKSVRKEFHKMGSKRALIASARNASSDASIPSSDWNSFCNRDSSDCSHVYPMECREHSDVHNVSHVSNEMSSSSSEVSSSFQKCGSRMKGSTCGLSPYLSSKLKPGKHILGVKKHQNFIRPGQLRHWALVKSPSLNLANLPTTSAKGKACRTLTF